MTKNYIFLFIFLSIGYTESTRFERADTAVAGAGGM
jgi:hypothetical protein